MIIARVEGGLGNQLFIYACARALALRHKRELVLDTHNAGYDGSDPFQRRYQLDQFPIHARLAGAEELQRFRRDSRSFYWLKKISRWLPWGWGPILEERGGFHARFLARDVSNPVYLLGYWQDERYFLDASDNIASELSPFQLSRLVDAEELRVVAAEDTVVIHVRRQNFPCKLGSDYYLTALQSFDIDRRKTRFVVFGDSSEWVCEALDLPEDTVFMNRDRTKSDLADLYLMSCAKRLIIANSTFSWWAAWFAGRNGAQVVAPKHWGYPAMPSARWRVISSDRYWLDESAVMP